MKTKKRTVALTAVITATLGTAIAAPTPSYGHVDCTTIESCSVLKNQVDAHLTKLLKKVAPPLTPIANDRYGNVLRLTQEAAAEHCEKNNNMRLPKARELAMYAYSRGATGLIKTKHPNVVRSAKAVRQEIKEMTSKGYTPIYTANTMGLPVVDFYFNSKPFLDSYTPEKETLWSSSSHPENPDYSYVLTADEGHLTLQDGAAIPSNAERDRRAFRCIPQTKE